MIRRFGLAILCEVSLKRQNFGENTNPSPKLHSCANSNQISNADPQTNRNNIEFTGQILSNTFRVILQFTFLHFVAQIGITLSQFC